MWILFSGIDDIIYLCYGIEIFVHITLTTSRFRRPEAALDLKRSRASRFLLCMLSPVWRATICGSFEESSKRLHNLGREDESYFAMLLELASGTSVTWNRGLLELIEMGKMADRYQLEPVQSTVEDAVLECLRAEDCGVVWMHVSGSGLQTVEAGCRELALSRFDDFVIGRDGISVFGDADALSSLLDDDNLKSKSEEDVLAAVMQWITSRSEQKDIGKKLLRKIRFPWMRKSFLEREIKLLYRHLWPGPHPRGGSSCEFNSARRQASARLEAS
jgi:hypothetical protein